MALPERFNPFEHLQDLIRKEHNKVVARFFKDLGPEDWQLDTSTPRSSLRTGCTIQDGDTADMTLMRLYLFYEILGYGRKRLGNFYGVPATSFQESFEGKPEVFLYFSQDKDSVPEGYTPVDAEISFRLMDETSASITEGNALTLAKAIKAELTENNKGITFNKGKNIVSYTDRSLGYKFQVYTSSQKDGEEIIKKVMSIRNHVPDDLKIKISTPKKNSINIPKGTELVYGKQRKKRRWRPTAKVRFRYAYLYIHGIEQQIMLLDTTGYWIDALIRI